MKTAKQILCLLLALMMVLSLSLTAFATETPPETTYPNSEEPNPKPTPKNMQGILDGGSITIENAPVDDVYTIYQILYLESYDPDTHAYTYKANTLWKPFLESETGKKYVAIDAQGYVTWVQNADVIKFTNDALAYAKDPANPIPEVLKKEARSSQEGVTNVRLTFDDLMLGYYLVDTTLGSLCILDTTDPSLALSEKNPQPTNVKKVEEDDKPGAYSETENDADIGQDINFQSTIKVQRGIDKLSFHDTMDVGLTFNGSTSVSVYYFSSNITSPTAVLVNPSNYEIIDYTDEAHKEQPAEDGCTFEVVFKPEFLARIEAGADDNGELYVRYSAKLNDKAVIAGPGNLNKSHIQYGEKNHTTEDSITKTYTWEFNIFKFTMQGSNKLPLEGAEFVLTRTVQEASPDTQGDTSLQDLETHTEYFCQNPTTKEVSWYRLNPALEDGNPESLEDAISAGKVTKFTTGADGRVHVSGLDSGNNYSLVEVKAPDGYNKLATPTNFTIKAIDNDGNGGKVTDGTQELADKTVEVENKTGGELPSTGGIGTTIFYVVGSLLLVGAVVLLITKKRMNASK